MLHDVAALCMVAVAAYAQWRLSRDAYGAANAWTARLLLAFLGIGLGALGLRIMEPGEVSSLTVFLIGFGQVHVPPAIVIFLSRKQRVGAF